MLFCVKLGTNQNKISRSTGTIGSIASISDTAITLDITGATISDSDTVTVTYAQLSGSIDDANGNILQNFATQAVSNTLDTTVPTISSITSDATASGTLKVDDTITFTAASDESGASVTGSYNSQPLTWGTANSGVTFTATYTVTETDSDQSTALQISGVTMTDASGNTSVSAAGADIVKLIEL